MALRASAAVAFIRRGRNPRIVSLYPHLRSNKVPAFSATSLHGRISSPHLKQGNRCNQSFRTSDLLVRAINTEATVGTEDMIKENDKLSQNWKVKMLYDGDCPLCMREAMGRIHAILSNGTIVTDVEAFRRLYEAVGLGWIYAITKYKPIGNVVDAVYAVWAKYRMQITGRPPLEDVLEERRKKMGEVCKDSNSCKM